MEDKVNAIQRFDLSKSTKKITLEFTLEDILVQVKALQGTKKRTEVKQNSGVVIRYLEMILRLIKVYKKGKHSKFEDCSMNM